MEENKCYHSELPKSEDALTEKKEIHLEQIQSLVERNTLHRDSIAEHSADGVPERSCFASTDTEIHSQIMLCNNTIENNNPKKILFYSKSSVPTTRKECTSQKVSDKLKGNWLHFLNYLIFSFYVIRLVQISMGIIHTLPFSIATFVQKL